MPPARNLSARQLIGKGWQVADSIDHTRGDVPSRVAPCRCGKCSVVLNTWGRARAKYIIGSGQTSRRSMGIFKRIHGVHLGMPIASKVGADHLVVPRR